MKTKFHVFIALFLFILTGCKDSVPLSESGIVSNLQSGKYVFTLDDAVQYAESAPLPGEEIATRSGRTVAQAASIGDDVPDMHVVNYAGGGYAIISADMRLEPVLAYSYEGNFDLDGEIPYGFQMWMDNVRQDIAVKRSQNAVQSPALAARWTAFTGNIAMVMPPPTSCSPNGAYYPNYHTELYGPLLPVAVAGWHQLVGFNDALNSMGCTTITNGKPPVGCVALSCAQIMRYHQKPTNLNWASMGSGSSALQTLLKNLGTQLQMDYTCNGSGAYSYNVPGVLINNYGYSSCSYSGYNYNSLYSFLSANKPVIMDADNTGDGKRHMWVCDGIELVYDATCNGNTIEMTLWNKYLHMVWGTKHGSSYNSYCAEGYFNLTTPDDSCSFNSNIILFFPNK